MRFKLKLDEALFDDDVEFFVDSKPASINDIDDSFELDEHDISYPGPEAGDDTGVYNEFIALVNDEWEAIQGYTNMIATLRAVSQSNPFYQEAITVLEEIATEENKHVGQLQELMKKISPNTNAIADGEVEAKKQLSQFGMVGGVMPVQSWRTTSTNSQEHAPCVAEDEACTLEEVDDFM